ncbi:MAG TPA: NAD(P)/FAD-dependent oxidoreductase [Pelobium sp.]
METSENNNASWAVCLTCMGQGKKPRKLRKKVRKAYQDALLKFESSTAAQSPPVKPKADLYPCKDCAGKGIIPTDHPPQANKENYPHVAIIGAGIGGMALAVACLHRGIPFTIFERDNSFRDRSQGYGLTLQQASKAIEALGITTLTGGVVSTRHLVHTTDGKVIAEWGMRKWVQSTETNYTKRSNIHIARQSLRLQLMQQLGANAQIKWGHRLVAIHTNPTEKTNLTFSVNGKKITTAADLVVGADGIRSTVRKLLIGEDLTPLRYLGCIVILGICPLNALSHLESDLLDSATVFQTANGTERIYMMPYSKEAIMWQLSFPMLERDAKTLSALGSETLKEEASRRTKWHSPIPQIIAATSTNQISGYPVYDRALLQPKILAANPLATLIGDAAHPMSPFKGQGANQALLDALSLARHIFRACRPVSKWRETGLRQAILDDFEKEMLERSAVKVKDSAEAADFLHSEMVLLESDQPRGKALKSKG